MVYMDNGECLPAIFSHRLCEISFWDFNVTIYVQTKFSGHIIPLANGNSISDVVGRIVIEVKDSIHSYWTP